jgi:hypothetical protein
MQVAVIWQPVQTTQECSGWALATERSSATLHPKGGHRYPARQRECLADPRGVDARHNAVGIAAEAAQLLCG